MKLIFSILIFIFFVFAIYSLSQWILLRQGISKTKAKVISVFTSCLFFLIFRRSVIMTVLLLLNYNNHGNQIFSIDKWHSDVQKRYEMRNYIIDKNLFVNKSKREVYEQIGKPEFVYESNSNGPDMIGYDLGSETIGLWRLAIYNLRLGVKNDTIIEVKLNTIID